MQTRDVTPFQKAVDATEEFSPEDKYSVLELIHHRLVETRRLEMAENARVTLRAIKEGSARCGSVEDLKRDLKG